MTFHVRSDDGMTFHVLSDDGVGEARMPDWVTCTTCKGSGYSFAPDSWPPCLDCVDGMIPSPELIERVALTMFEVGAKNGDDGDRFRLLARVGLLASRREGETR